MLPRILVIILVFSPLLHWDSAVVLITSAAENTTLLSPTFVPPSLWDSLSIL